MINIFSMNDLVFGDVATMLRAEYEGDSSMDDSVVVLGYNLPHCTPELVREKFPGKRIIVYNLEQFHAKSPWFYDKHVSMWLKTADEVWEYDLDNLEYLHAHGLMAKYHPMHYTAQLSTIPNLDARPIDVLFYGSPTPRRMRIIGDWMTKSVFTYHTVFCTGVKGAALDDYISRSKVILNLHAFDLARQEQVRIFRLVCNHCCVISEKSPKNEFGKSIVECTAKELPAVIAKVITSGDWRKIADTAPDVYRAHCERRH